jgi:glycosyltransferase involved in cell wall biosynthesis
VYPPVDTGFFSPRPGGPSRIGFVMVSALVPYKRVDLAIAACRRAGAPLTDRRHRARNRRVSGLAGPDTSSWAGAATRRSGSSIAGPRRAAARRRGFRHGAGRGPGLRRPVVALGAGGALETVVDGETGVLVADATVEAFADGLARVERTRFDRAAIRANADGFHGNGS